MARFLRIEVSSEELPADEVWRHDVPEDTDKHAILTAIETLYGDKDVTGINIFIQEDE